MARMIDTGIDVGEESRIILQSLLCLLREKNILNRADIEDLKHRVELRAAGVSGDSLPCCPDAALAAVEDMKKMSSYLGQRYGGKHARHLT